MPESAEGLPMRLVYADRPLAAVQRDAVMR
jgi:hypothetical protein